MHRRPILTAAILVLLSFGALTVYVIVDTGRFGPLEAISLLVMGFFAFGIIGALRAPPE